MLMMLPFEAPTIFEGIHKSYFRMPRVVKDQRGKFENDDLFRQLSPEGPIKYTGFKDRPLEERQMKFIANCQEGHTEVSFVQSGNQFTLMFNPTANPAYSNEGCDFDRELGKVHIKAGFILNGVCVLWRGWIDLQRLEGLGCLEFDEYRAYMEEAMLKQLIDKHTPCNNNNTTANRLLQSSPLARLNPTSHPHLANQGVQQQQPPPPPSLQAPVAPNSHLVSGQNAMQPAINASCLGLSLAPPSSVPHGVPHGVSMGRPPVSLAESAAHYGNAAIAAAAAAAFHQALGVDTPQQQALHALGTGGQASALSAAAAAAAASMMPPATHLPYSTNSLTNGAKQPSQLSLNRSPTQQQQMSNLHQTNGITPTTRTSPISSRSPDRDQSVAASRQAMKRSIQEQTNVDDVDVVSDIHTHELDLPPRRMFKSSPLTTGHHNQMRATRRA